MTADERRLLELLAGSADGCTDAALAAQGFKLDVLISIASAEFATAQPERTFAAGKPVEAHAGTGGRRGAAACGLSYCSVPGCVVPVKQRTQRTLKVAMWAAVIAECMNVGGFLLHLQGNVEDLQYAYSEAQWWGVSGELIGRFIGVPVIFAVIAGIVAWVYNLFSASAN
jgi:hypothetical protein